MNFLDKNKKRILPVSHQAPVNEAPKTIIPERMESMVIAQKLQDAVAVGMPVHILVDAALLEMKTHPDSLCTDAAMENAYHSLIPYYKK